MWDFSPGTMAASRLKSIPNRKTPAGNICSTARARPWWGPWIHRPIAGDTAALDLAALKAACHQGQTIDSRRCYEAFRSVGIDYGPGHQGIASVHIGPDHVLAKLSLPASLSDDSGPFILHPCLMDSALQATIGLAMDPQTASPKAFLPFELRELTINSGCAADMWVRIRRHGAGTGPGEAKLDIDICDDTGKICVQMKGLATRSLQDKAGAPAPPSHSGVLMLGPEWREQTTVPETTAPEYDRHLVMLCHPADGLVNTIKADAEMTGVHCTRLISQQESLENRSPEKRFHHCATGLFRNLQSILKENTRDRVLVQVVFSTETENRLLSGLSGLLKTAHLEHPKLVGQIIGIESPGNASGAAALVKADSRCPGDAQIIYRDGKRWVPGWREIHVPSRKRRSPWQDGGVYLITGGLGGLGLIFSREIVRKTTGATLILVGRKPPAAANCARIEAIRQSGGAIDVRQIDVTSGPAVEDPDPGHSGKIRGTQRHYPQCRCYPGQLHL